MRRPHGVARVMIVDRSASVRRSLGRSLGLVADVTVRDSWEAALETLRAESTFDLVLCDATAGADALLREARTLAPDCACRFVVLTADPGRLPPELAEAPCLTKPLDRDQIDALVAGLMRATWG